MATTTVTEGETTASDAEIVRAILDGDRSAFAELYDRHAGLVRAVCYDQTGDLTEAQDLAQEAFLRAYQKLATLRDPAKFGPWLIGITKKICRQWRRSKSRDRHRFSAAPIEDPTSDQSPPEPDQSRRILEAVRSLPDKQRTAIHAFYLLGRSAEQARAALGLSRSGFYKLLERARNRLRRLMTEDGRDSHE